MKNKYTYIFLSLYSYTRMMNIFELCKYFKYLHRIVGMQSVNKRLLNFCLSISYTFTYVPI
jgi:hypothetical protein